MVKAQPTNRLQAIVPMVSVCAKPKQPPRGEHQANGAVEEAGKSVREMARVFKLQLEARIGREVMMNEPVMEWLIRRSAMNLSRDQVGRDRKTPYQWPVWS